MQTEMEGKEHWKIGETEHGVQQFFLGFWKQNSVGNYLDHQERERFFNQWADKSRFKRGWENAFG